MKKYMLLVLLSIYGHAQQSGERFFKDKNAHANGFGIHTDLGYSSYLIELDSSELNSAIDYDVLEFTLGETYSYERWMVGLYGKFLVEALNSNMFVVTTAEKLGDHAKIDKNEFGVYLNYTLAENDKHRWSLNAIYRYSRLEAEDSYRSFLAYQSSFDYETQGLALSLGYLQRLSEQSSWFAQVGLLYSKANVKMAESVNGQLQDSFVDDTVNSIGKKVTLGYSYRLDSKFFLVLRADAWSVNFGALTVLSRVGDSLPKATLNEHSFTTYTGISWRF